MFTLAQIEEAHSNVESGKGFPEFAKTIRELGVKSLETFVEDGSTNYLGDDDYKVSSTQKYAPLLIYGIPNPEKFLADLRNHQQGGTDFFQFCKDCADSGVYKWIVDIDAKTCTYYTETGAVVFEEQIPI
ncbi:DUF1398 domain-containing protein [Epilithonimonas mollis]|uniref:Uncharacterized conserved protein YbcV, DUF1398 family n=1 Tax=Epilithonimonas mollis TaxID=216903 RepID=A0A1M6RY93_9FLAO|nr:DUF1398 family protein [Epilithonimonas mollis]SHK37436.1 Uncharacterized conserved protein YbcV, DUF1398 family [Epilithonimonas mollis]